MENQGWIKLHRKLRDNPIYSNSTAMHIWIECLFRASFGDNNFFLSRQKVKLEPGQFAMGREEFGKRISISGSTVRFWLEQFRLDSMIDIKKSNKGSIVTILKWKDYQVLDSKSDNRKTTDEQQMNTIKNVKKDKNEKNNTLQLAVASEDIVKVIEVFSKLNPLISYGNKTYRKSASDLIDKFGLEKAISASEYAISIQGDKYAPRITNPYQLSVKLGDLVSYKKKSEDNLKGIII